MKFLLKISHRATIVILLLYFYIQVTKNHMVITLQPNILSEKLSLYMNHIPTAMYYVFLISFIILIIVSLYTKSFLLSITYSILASIVVTIAFLVTKDLILLNNETVYGIFKIYHPIPFDTKLEYFKVQFSTYLSQCNLDAYTLSRIKAKMPAYLMEIHLQHLNCEGLNKYAHNIILDNYTEVQQLYVKSFDAITFTCTISGGILAIYSLILTYDFSLYLN